jgi:hypothetical protein
MTSADKVVFRLLPKSATLEDFVELYRHLTGREPTRQEIQDAVAEMELTEGRAELQEVRGPSGVRASGGAGFVVDPREKKPRTDIGFTDDPSRASTPSVPVMGVGPGWSGGAEIDPYGNLVPKAASPVNAPQLAPQPATTPLIGTHEPEPSRALPPRAGRKKTAEEFAKWAQQNPTMTPHGEHPDPFGGPLTRAIQADRLGMSNLGFIAGKHEGYYKPVSGMNVLLDAAEEYAKYQGYTPAIARALAERQVGHMRRTIDDHTQHHREVAASRVAKLTDVADMVPHTEYHNHPTMGPGSISEWMEHTPALYHPMQSRYGTRDEAQRAAAFDYLIGNTDRHSKNFGLDTNGHLVLIDHGLALPKQMAGEPFGSSELFAHARVNNLPIPENVKNWDWKKIQQALASSNIEPEAIAEAHRRYVNLRTSKTFGQLQPFGLTNNINERA